MLFRSSAPAPRHAPPPHAPPSPPRPPLAPPPPSAPRPPLGTPSRARPLPPRGTCVRPSARGICRRLAARRTGPSCHSGHCLGSRYRAVCVVITPPIARSPAAGRCGMRDERLADAWWSSGRPSRCSQGPLPALNPGGLALRCVGTTPAGGSEAPVLQIRASPEHDGMQVAYEARGRRPAPYLVQASLRKVGRSPHLRHGNQHEEHPRHAVSTPGPQEDATPPQPEPHLMQAPLRKVGRSPHLRHGNQHEEHPPHAVGEPGQHSRGVPAPVEPGQSSQADSFASACSGEQADHTTRKGRPDPDERRQLSRGCPPATGPPRPPGRRRWSGSPPPTP